MLDGEGGFTVWGRLYSAADSLRLGGLPIGLAHHVRLKNTVKSGQPVRWDDVEFNPQDDEVKFRKQMETEYQA